MQLLWPFVVVLKTVGWCWEFGRETCADKLPWADQLPQRPAVLTHVVTRQLHEQHTYLPTYLSTVHLGSLRLFKDFAICKLMSIYNNITWKKFWQWSVLINVFRAVFMSWNVTNYILNFIIILKFIFF